MEQEQFLNNTKIMFFIFLKTILKNDLQKTVTKQALKFINVSFFYILAYLGYFEKKILKYVDIENLKHFECGIELKKKINIVVSN